jgi:hypothetical protein
LRIKRQKYLSETSQVEKGIITHLLTYAPIPSFAIGAYAKLIPHHVEVLLGKDFGPFPSAHASHGEAEGCYAYECFPCESAIRQRFRATFVSPLIARGSKRILCIKAFFMWDYY